MSKYRKTEQRRLEKAQEACNEIIKRGYDTNAIILAKNANRAIQELLLYGKTLEWEEENKYVCFKVRPNDFF